MRPPAHVIRRAVENGTIDRLNQLLSACHILFCEASALYGEAEDLMRGNGMMLGELKQSLGRYMKAQDGYFREFTAMIEDSGQGMRLFRDLDGFDEWFREWAKLPKDWEPKTLTDKQQ